jgi:hypothetical protein
MSARPALITGTVVSAAVTGAWSYMASPTIGPAVPFRLGRNLPGDYARLADAPTGNGWELFTAVTVIYALCLLASGWRQYRRRTDGGG